MPDLSEDYQCQSLGCPNGQLSLFSAAPRSWWAEKGITTPKNCPTCRAWVKAQRDETIRCETCRNTLIRVPARYKISHHKRVGTYTAPTECRACERGMRPPKSVRPPPSERRKDEADDSDFSNLPIRRMATSYSLDVEEANYNHTVPRKTETRRVHIEKHTAWSPYSQTSANDPDRKSESALAEDAYDFRALLRSAAVVANTQAAEVVREYRGRTNGNIIKVIQTARGRIEATIISPAPGPGGHELLTTYDGWSVAEVEAKLKPNAQKGWE